eukprot:scaffold216607_cov17-Tisochrysis_lutea.AAC.2
MSLPADARVDAQRSGLAPLMAFLAPALHATPVLHPGPVSTHLPHGQFNCTDVPRPRHEIHATASMYNNSIGRVPHPLVAAQVDEDDALQRARSGTQKSECNCA